MTLCQIIFGILEEIERVFTGTVSDHNVVISYLFAKNKEEHETCISVYSLQCSYQCSRLASLALLRQVNDKDRRCLQPMFLR